MTTEEPGASHHDGAAPEPTAAGVAPVPVHRSRSAIMRSAARQPRTRLALASVTALVVLAAVAVPLTVNHFQNATKPPAVQADLNVRSRAGDAVELVAVSQPATSMDRSAEQAVASTEQAIALALLQQLQKTETGNVVFSPSSLATALSMLNLGSGGKTAAQISKLLGPSGSTPDQIASGWSSLVADWAKSAAKDHTSLSSANSVWLQRGSPMVSKFMSQLGEYFQAGVWQVDFLRSPAKAAADLNSWVDRQTKGHIRELVTKDDVARLLLVLVNAVYLDAKWSTPFSSGGEPAPFTLADGSITTVPTMDQVMTVPVVSDGQLEAAELPYVGGRFSALVIEPQTADLNSYVSSLTSAGLESVVDSLRAREAMVQLPEFAFQTSADLKQPLTALGMTYAFDPELADLRPMSPDAGYVAFVKQKATIGVDRTGTTATAATAIGVAPTSGHGPSSNAILFDHPFLFLIRDRQTGAILFAAKVLDPARH